MGLWLLLTLLNRCSCKSALLNSIYVMRCMLVSALILTTLTIYPCSPFACGWCAGSTQGRIPGFGRVGCCAGAGVYGTPATLPGSVANSPCGL